MDSSVATTPTTSSQPPTIAQQSLQDASVVYTSRLGRPAQINNKAAASSAAHARNAHGMDRHATFPAALRAVARNPSEEAIGQLLEQHLFGKTDMKVRHAQDLHTSALGGSAPKVPLEWAETNITTAQA